MDAIELLTDDHNTVRELFRQFNGGGGITGLVRRTMGSVSAAERRTAVDQVCKQLAMHTRIEEEVFYPAVTALGDSELNTQIDEALSEHAKVKREVALLRGLKRADAERDELMSRLEKDVEHHASEEEKEMFPRLEELMSETERQELARRMQALKRGGRSPKASASPRRAPSRKKAVVRKKTVSRSAGTSSRGKASTRTKSRGKASTRTKPTKRARARTLKARSARRR